MIDINLTFIGQTITFVLLIIFCKLYVWPPVIKALRDRQEKISEGLENYVRAKKLLEDAKTESHNMLLESKQLAKVEANEIVAGAKKEAENLKEEAIRKANSMVEDLVKTAKQDILNQHDKLAEDISQSIKETSVFIATTILKKELEVKPEFDNKFIAKSIERVLNR